MKNNWKKVLMIVFSTLLILSACGENEGEKQETSGKKFKIGVTQIAEHPSLDAAFIGFKKAIEDAGLHVDYEVKIAAGDMSANTTIATDLVNSNVDLIFANTTDSAMAVVGATKEIPIVFTSVTDAVGADLVESMEKPGGNVTGTSDTHPDAIPNTMKFLKEQLGAKTIGMVFNAGEQNSRAQVDTVKKILEELDMKVEEASVSTTAEVKQATESLIGKVDAFYIITDNTVVSALESVISVANENEIPLMVGEFDSVKRGGLGAFGFDYYDIGYEAGEMAVKILKGEKKPSELPVQYPQNLKLVINKDAAAKMGVTIKDEWNAEFTE